MRVSVLCPSYVQSNVIATTARFAASNNSEPSIGDSKLEERPALTEAEKEEINSELAGLAALVGVRDPFRNLKGCSKDMWIGSDV